MIHARLAFVLLVVVVWTPAKIAAAPSIAPLRAYIHTTWTHHDGVPLGVINKILQTSDGYLWIFANDGVLRFDGMRFVRPSTPCVEPIRSHAPAIDGGFWAVCGDRLIRRTADARFVVVSDGLLNLPQHTLLADRRGRLWILGKTIRYLNQDGTGGRVFDNPRTELFFAAVEDSEGTIWARDPSNLYHLYDDRVELVMSLDAPGCLTPSRDGGVYAVLRTGIWHLRKGVAPSVLEFPYSEASATAEACMAEAPDGGLWLAMRQSVVARLHRGHLESLADTGQVERHVTDVFIDREGSIWAGATSGLHRFRKPTVQLVRGPADSGQPWFVFVDAHTNLWLGGTLGASRLNPERRLEPSVTPRGPYAAIGQDEKGTIWLSNEEAIGYVANGKFVTVSDATGAPIVAVDAFTQDEQGHLWALSNGVGVYRVTPGPPRLVAASPRAETRFLVSQRSGIWLALASGGVEQHFNGRVNTLANLNPTKSYVSPMTMLEDGDSIWVGSFTGLDRLRHGRWTTWTREQGLPGDGRVKAMIADRSGHFWIMTGAGLLRVPRAQLDAAPDGSPTPLSFARIGSFDGVVPHPGNLRTSPTAASDRNGRLYFTTVDAVAIIDPDALSEASMIPPIVLESVIVDKDPVDHKLVTSFVEPSRLQFEYTSLDLRSPELARFRYRLQGYDADWIEAGTQRQVTYGTLRPGAYTFRVIGAGGEGIWNETGASFAFQIVPVFWRTWWFRLALVVVGVSLVAALYRLRVQQITRQFDAGLEARVSERTRIARELHDTLLQTFQGVLIHFQAATNLLPGRPDDARQKLESVLERAARAVTEGRDAVQALRESATASDDLPHALSVLAEQLVDDADPGHAVIRVNVEGRPRALRPIVRDDVYRIASEAMRNATRHARAQLIQADIHYDDRHLQLRIRDDGTGIDPATLEGRGVSGHWGLPGMRERATLIGGTLEVRSRPGSGTEVELSLPASKAYDTHDRQARYPHPRRGRS
jgi:signal transduction histidine kinase/ligand-binding sensor domain-containing protein